MKTAYFAAAALLALAACGPPAEAPAPEPSAPQSLMEQVQSMANQDQPVFAYQQLVSYQRVHPESQPPCNAPRATEARPIPANVAPDSIYAPFVGAAVYSVQCGELVSRTSFVPREHWLVVFAPGASEAQIVNCADARDRDQCVLPVPTVAAAPATP